MKWIWSLFLCLTASAQLPVIPFVLTSSANLTNLSGVAYRWVASDLQTNSALLSWTDEVQQLVWTNGAAANRPTNSALGIWFDATHFFTNSGMPTIGTSGNSNVSFGFIVNFEIPPETLGVHPGILDNSAQKTVVDAGYGGYVFDANISHYPLSYVNNDGFNVLSTAPFKDTNVITDLVISQICTNSPLADTAISYTNGIISFNVQVGIVGNQYIWGGQGANVLTPNSPNSLGRNRPRASSASFRLKELWVWTNSPPNTPVGSDLTPSLLAAFHKYATNTYKYSP